MEPISSLGRRLSLKPYGDELLTKSGDFWIFSARLIVFTMAAAEAIAWGYMGALMSRAHPFLAASIAAIFVFTLIWIIDATFMTLDLSRGFYERALTGKGENAARERLKLWGGVAARVAIVSASLFITAPFLAQAIFAADVEDEMQRRNAGAVAARRHQIEQPYLERLHGLRGEQKQLEEQRVMEAAGTGPSGRYGRGPALETIERQLADKRQEIEAVEASRAAAVERFDRFSPQELQQQHGLRFLAPGVSSSNEVLGQLMRNPQFAGSETAVRAFLAFLFLGLLILKAFQPRSIAVYYNEQLHSIYDEYRKGLFDVDLPGPERSREGGAIDPLRFEEWCVQSYAAIRGEDVRRRDTARQSRMHELLIEQWQQLEAAARREIEPLLQRHEATLAATHDLEAEIHAAAAASAAAKIELEKVEKAYDSMSRSMAAGDMDAATFQQAAAAGRDLDDRRRALAAAVAHGDGDLEAKQKRLEIRRSEAAMLRAEIDSRRTVIADAQERIAADRLKLAASVTAQRELWSGQAALDR